MRQRVQRPKQPQSTRSADAQENRRQVRMSHLPPASLLQSIRQPEPPLEKNPRAPRRSEANEKFADLRFLRRHFSNQAKHNSTLQSHAFARETEAVSLQNLHDRIYEQRLP